MILDAHELPDRDRLQADLCIVGAGAAGISMALELADTSIEVLVLESGGLKAEKDTQSLYAGAVADERLHSPPDTYRQRRFGACRRLSRGRCVR
ncbi:MAG: FAD-dependent oxidoreductase [Steroidobacteraceae bacterium]